MPVQCAATESESLRVYLSWIKTHCFHLSPTSFHPTSSRIIVSIWSCGSHFSPIRDRDPASRKHTASQRNMSTINEPPGLSELPIEMVLHIASFCPHDDRKAMSLVSKQMRSHLHRHLFRAVSFHGHGEQVLEALEEFLSGKSDLVNRGGYKHIL